MKTLLLLIAVYGIFVFVTSFLVGIFISPIIQWILLFPFLIGGFVLGYVGYNSKYPRNK